MWLAFLLALVAASIRWTLHVNGTLVNGIDFVPIHLLLLVIAVFVTGWRSLRADPTITFPGLMRSGFRAGAAYTLVIAVFVFALYTWIDPLFFPLRVDEMVQEALKTGHTEVEARERIEGFFSPFKYATITLAAFLVISALDALVCAALHHKLLRGVRR